MYVINFCACVHTHTHTHTHSVTCDGLSIMFTTSSAYFGVWYFVRKTLKLVYVLVYVLKLECYYCMYTVCI